MRILGMVSHTHDTGVALINDGQLEVVIEEERLNRNKKTQKFPTQALHAAITERGLTLDDIDCITMPWHIPTFWRTLSWALMRKFPHSLNLVHVRAHPPQQNQLFQGTRFLARCLREHFQTSTLPPIRGVGHHDSHAAAYYISPFEDATVLVMDGYGDDAATSIYRGGGDSLKRIWKSNIFNSLGILYTVVTQHLGFQPNGDEGKVMGLAAYGEPTYLKSFYDVVHLTDDGHYQLNMDYFNFDCYGLAKPFKQLFYDRFGPARHPGDDLNEHHFDIAHALQAVVERAILHTVRATSKRSRSSNICLVGGVALNCVANAKILEETDYEQVWIPPNASDTGATMGSALWHHHHTLRQPRKFQLRHAFYGKDYDQDAIQSALDQFGMNYDRLPDDELTERVAKDLSEGKIIGWFQGRFEMGPRALGNRSILADARRADMKDILNARVKHRESFRPFAPVILREKVNEWFHIKQADPFMTIAPRVRAERASLIPSGVHQDGTARIQTVEREENPRYYDLIQAFDQLTGVPIILNTSFNRQEPIVARPEEAISCFLRTDMDVLVMGNFYSTDHNHQSVQIAENRFASV